MKNIKKSTANTLCLLAITILVAVIAFSMAACGGDDIIDVVDDHNHTWGAWKDSAPATCTEPAKETRVCTEDKTHTETRNKPGSAALGHQAPDGYPATCTTAGNTGTGKCKRCGETVNGKAIPALGHDYQDWMVTTPPDCTTEGIETSECSHDSTHILTRPVSALGHDHTGSLTCIRGCGHQYAVGDDGPGGGKIFFVADGVGTIQLRQRWDGSAYMGNGSTPVEIMKPYGFSFADGTAYYLEVTLSDLSESMLMWAPTGQPVYTTTITDAVPTAIGSGKSNTAAILAVAAGDPETRAPAAHACNIYSTATTSAGDWFLPSLEELNQLYENKDELDITFNSSNYWSSSQYGGGDYASVFLQSFYSGQQIRYSKYNTYYVRAIRAF